jgi:hypothetical protein
MGLVHFEPEAAGVDSGWVELEFDEATDGLRTVVRQSTRIEFVHDFGNIIFNASTAS